MALKKEKIILNKSVFLLNFYKVCKLQIEAV